MLLDQQVRTRAGIKLLRQFRPKGALSFPISRGVILVFTRMKNSIKYVHAIGRNGRNR